MMGPDKHSGKHGLWRNIKYVQALMHWSLSQIADRAHYYAAHVSHERMGDALGLVIERRQLRWKYAPALALAWGIPELALLYGDFSACATLEDLKKMALTLTKSSIVGKRTGDMNRKAVETCN